MDARIIFKSHLDELISSLEQTDALLSIAISSNINEIKPKTMINYLCAANEIITKAKYICERLEKYSQV